MVEVNGAYKHGMYNKMNSLLVMPNVKVFAMQDGRTNITPYISNKETLEKNNRRTDQTNKLIHTLTH